MLSKLQTLFLNVGLYRDDGLGVTTQIPQQVEKTKKNVCDIFRNMGLKIAIDANKKVVDFLDVTLNLTSDTHKPFLKPNNKLLYVNSESNQPPHILENIPISVNIRLSVISSSEDIFNKIVKTYKDALDKS